MEFKNDYQRREFIGRQALLELKKKYPSLFQYKIFFTEGEFDVYDASFINIDINGEVIKRYWVEIKWRDSDYPDWYLEKKKLNSLRRLQKESGMGCDDVNFLYLNFTPNYTIMWNVTDIDENDTIYKPANRSTSKNRYDKVNKKFIPLEIKDGIKMDYILNEFKIIREYENKEKKRKLIKNNLIKKGIDW